MLYCPTLRNIHISLDVYFKSITICYTVRLPVISYHEAHSTAAQRWKEIKPLVLPGCGRIALKGKHPETVQLFSSRVASTPANTHML